MVTEPTALVANGRRFDFNSNFTDADKNARAESGAHCVDGEDATLNSSVGPRGTNQLDNVSTKRRKGICAPEV